MALKYRMQWNENCHDSYVFALLGLCHTLELILKYCNYCDTKIIGSMEWKTFKMEVN